MPACRIDAVTRPPTLDLAFMVSRVAATSLVNAAKAELLPLKLEKTVGTDAPILISKRRAQ